VQQRAWGLLFGAVLLAELALCLAAPFCGWWLPKNVAAFGGDIDFLFYVILGFTGFFFLLPQAILVYAMLRYVEKPGEKATYTHGNHRLELLWTVVPAAILLFIAFAQVRAWERIKYQSRSPKPDQVVQVYARQWEWRMRYPTHDIEYKKEDQKALIGELKDWAETPLPTDLHGVNELHTWKDANIQIYLKTHDVIHSFFLPNLRFKQDALPGKTIPIWLNVTESNTRFDEATGRCTEPADKSQAWEIACAELCGGGHFRMRGRLYVHPDEKDYLKWRDHNYKQQQAVEPEKPPSARPY
jgi:cytochrome c oxidase subunit 2